jgi:acetyl-CoA carboxylase biotin carboxyl carrier protein
MTQIKASITGNVWKILVKPGDAVDEDDEVAILESMKMEIPIESTDSGTVTEVRVKEGDSVKEGDVLVVLDG